MNQPVSPRHRHAGSDGGGPGGGGDGEGGGGDGDGNDGSSEQTWMEGYGARVPISYRKISNSAALPSEVSEHSNL